MLALAKRPEALSSLTQVQIGGPQPPIPTLANGRHLTGACVVGSEYGPLHREGRMWSGSSEIGVELTRPTLILRLETNHNDPRPRR
jgi:hypothetical protein